MGKKTMKGYGPNDAKRVESYTLYLEGLANELIHLLQRQRRGLKLDIIDKVNIGLVQNNPDRLTSAIYIFVNKIIERIRIVDFYPNPLPGVKVQKYNFIDHFKKPFTFDIYMEKA